MSTTLNGQTYDNHVHISLHTSDKMNIRTEGKDIGKGTGSGSVETCKNVLGNGNWSLKK